MTALRPLLAAALLACALPAGCQPSAPASAPASSAASAAAPAASATVAAVPASATAPAASATVAAAPPEDAVPEGPGAPPPPESDVDGLLPPMHEWALPDDAALPPGAQLHNYGGATQPWLAKLRHLGHTRRAQGSQFCATTAAGNTTQVLRIVVLGDSHTAGGFMTDALRHRLQARLCSAGPGWAQAARIKGQNTSIIAYQGWTPTSSRHNDPGEFTVGGVNAASDGGELRINARSELRIATSSHPMQLHLLARSDNPGVPLYVREESDTTGAWQRMHTASERPGWQLLTLDTPTHTPLLVRDPLSRWTLAAVGLENGYVGATVSAMGINGAQITETNKWRKGWVRELALMQPDLVVLEYGTNEVWRRSDMPWDALERHWQRLLTDIHAALPRAGILIIAPPGALQGFEGACGQNPPHLARMQALQERLARRHKALYWSWQDAMGGACSMKHWMETGLAGSDGVHFTREGYWRLGGLLADAILTLGATEHTAAAGNTKTGK